MQVRNDSKEWNFISDHHLCFLGKMMKDIAWASKWMSWIRSCSGPGNECAKCELPRTFSTLRCLTRPQGTFFNQILSHHMHVDPIHLETREPSTPVINDTNIACNPFQAKDTALPDPVIFCSYIIVSMPDHKTTHICFDKGWLIQSYALIDYACHLCYEKMCTKISFIYLSLQVLMILVPFCFLYFVVAPTSSSSSWLLLLLWLSVANVAVVVVVVVVVGDDESVVTPLLSNGKHRFHCHVSLQILPIIVTPVLAIENYVV